MGDKKNRRQVRVQRADTKCGAVDHMTVDEIKARALDENVELACPECGEIHLTPEDATAASQRKFTETRRFKTIVEQAEDS